MEAGRLADDLIFEPGFVRGGPATISQHVVTTSRSSTCSTVDDVTGETEPECWLYHQADFMLQASFRIGRPARFGHRLLHASADRSESADSRDRSARPSHRRWSTRPRFGPSWSSSPVRSGVSAGPRDRYGGFISPNRRFDASAYGDANLDPTVEVRTRLASVAQTALASGLFRFDASDLMPIEIGASTERRR